MANPELSKPRRLWTVRILVVLSVLYTSWLLARTVEDFRDPCLDVSIGWIVVHVMLLAPYLAVLWFIQIGQLKNGLALALAWAPMTLFWILPALFEALKTDIYLNLGSVMFYRGGFLFFLVQIPLTISASWTYFKLTRHSKGKLGRVAVGSLGYVTLVVVIGWYSWPVDPYPALTYYAVVGRLRGINNAEASYAARYAEGFSANLAALGDPVAGSKPSATAAGLIDKYLASGTAVGYAFTYAPGQPNSDGHIHTYIVGARSLRRKCGPNYFTDQSEVIRRTAEDRPATAQDPALQ